MRIFPIYFLLILFLTIINFQNTREILPWITTYTINIYQSFTNLEVGNFNHFWTLSIEEQFYIFWPFLILLTKKPLQFIIATIFISMGFKFYFYFFSPNWMAVSYFTICAFHSLAIGALLAYLIENKKIIIKKIDTNLYLYLSFSLFIIILIIRVFFKLEFLKFLFEDLVFSIAAFFIVLRAINKGFNGFIKVFLENKFIIYLGKISYGLYLFHLFIPDLIKWVWPEMIAFNANYSVAKYFLLTLYFLVTILISSISWFIIEKPLNKLKNKVSN